MRFNEKTGKIDYIYNNFFRFFKKVWWHYAWFDFKKFIIKTKEKTWEGGIILWWYRLYIRKDEFHHSLDLDHKVMLNMNDKERKKYLDDLVKRREIAHKRDLRRNNLKSLNTHLKELSKIAKAWKKLLGKHYEIDKNNPPYPTRKSVDNALDEIMEKIKN